MNYCSILLFLAGVFHLLFDRLAFPASGHGVSVAVNVVNSGTAQTNGELESQIRVQAAREGSSIPGKMGTLQGLGVLKEGRPIPAHAIPVATS